MTNPENLFFSLHTPAFVATFSIEQLPNLLQRTSIRFRVRKVLGNGIHDNHSEEHEIVLPSDSIKSDRVHQRVE